MAKPGYLNDFETLTALVTQLALSRYRLRTPPSLAVATSIDEREITRVLETFKGLFRKSPSESKGTSGPMYALQLRDALQWTVGQKEDEQAVASPIGPEHLVPLMELITARATEEARRNYTIYAALIGAASGVIVTIIGYGILKLF